MTTPLLGIAEVVSTQADKTTTINDAILALENATQAGLAVSFAGGNVTLSAAQYASSVAFRCSGQTAAVTLTVPLTQRAFFVDNTAGTFSVTVGGASGASVAVAPGTVAALLCDGSACKSANGTGGGGSGEWTAGIVTALGAGLSIPAMASHRYWRINITAVIGGNNVNLAEIQMASSTGGADLFGSGTAFASAAQGSGYSAAKACDGDVTTWWSTPDTGPSTSLPQWWAYDFGSAVLVTEVRISPLNVSGSLYAPTAFTLDVSDDGSTWSTGPAFTSATWASGVTQSFDAAAASTLVAEWNAGTVTTLGGGLSLASGALVGPKIAIPFAFSGLPGAGQMLHYPLLADGLLTIPAGFTGTAVYVGSNPTATATFVLYYVRSGTPTAIGTVAISTAGAATLTAASAYTAISGDVLRLEAPATPDATLADVAFTFEATHT